jgi:DNA-binding MarR family transcriptional regulator
MPDRTRQEIADLLHSASIHLLRRAGEEDAQSGLGAARLSALSVLVFRGPLTMGQLAAAEGVRSPTMTRIVRGLEQAGLARRRTHEGDRRATLVEATSQGEHVLKEARARRIERISAALVELDHGELEGVGRAAETVERLFGSRERPWRPLRRS